MIQSNFILTATYLKTSQMTQRRLWTQQQDQVIKRLVKEYGTKKWTIIAQQMKRVIKDKGRSSKQIRQRWHNHLDPSVNKKQWSSQQQKILFDSHRLYGSKWKQIANKLSGRTDNHVKNYFYSTMRRALRRINKYLGSKNSTTQMRTIRPSILSYLLDLADNDMQIRSLVSRIFELSKCKPKKASKQVLIADEQRQKYQAAIKKLNQINEMYTKNGVKKFYEIQQARKVEIKHQPNVETKPEIQPNLFTKQEQVDSQSWENQDQNEESNNYHLMPQLQRPEYECDLLAKKQENLQPIHLIQCCAPEGLWSQCQTIQAINLFQF